MKTMQNRRLPCKPSEVICLIWLDAQGESTRSNYDNVKQITLAVNSNIGWIADENDERIVFAHGSSTSGELDVFTIPKVNILERIPLVKERKKAKSQKKEINQEENKNPGEKKI